MNVVVGPYTGEKILHISRPKELTICERFTEEIEYVYYWQWLINYEEKKKNNSASF